MKPSLCRKQQTAVCGSATRSFPASAILLPRAESRIAELDNLFKHLYEDNVTGKLSDERFIKMSHDYELEQDNLKAMAEVLREEIKQQEKKKTNVKAFISAVKKYTDMQDLDASILREFIDRIEVSHTDKKSKDKGNNDCLQLHRCI